MRNIPIFVTHYGCPHKCIFCNQKKISGYAHGMDLKLCETILEDTSKRNYPKNETEVAFFGGSFTGIPKTIQEQYLSLAKRYDNFFSSIRLSTRPDYITPENLNLLKEYGVKTVELGVQSMVDTVLLRNNRAMSSDCVKTAVTQLREFGFSVGLQMMTSMYGATREDDLYTADCLVSLKPDFVRIYPTVVLEDTKLYELYRNGEYRPLTLEQTVSHVADVYEKFANAFIPVIRVGLQSGEEIRPDKVHGCYHEALGELVLSELFYRNIKRKIPPSSFGKILTVTCQKHQVSQVVGHKKQNFQRLKEEFGFHKIRLQPTDVLTKELFWVEVSLQSL